jgi:hypothetical protein
MAGDEHRLDVAQAVRLAAGPLVFLSGVVLGRFGWKSRA